MEAAARLFAAHGFHGASLRDIAKEAEITPGSIYAHFRSKSHLLAAIYEEGVACFVKSVDRALEKSGGPWDRLERACEAHLETLLEDNPYATVVVRVQPSDAPEVASALTALRDGYELRFRQIAEQLELGAEVNATQFRLLLLGALNWSQAWYKPGGTRPKDIAKLYVAMLRNGVAREREMT